MYESTIKSLKRVFNHMKERCYNKRDKRYKDWGGRGITVCKEWLEDRNLFFEWAINNGYHEGLTIDRIDNDGPYAPWNCRWVSIAENNQNRRSSRFYTIDGETKNLKQWCDLYSISWSTVNKRIKLGWDLVDALTKPIRSRDTNSLISKKFGKLTVIKFAGTTADRKTKYECLCDCGKISVVSADKLKRGHTISCGCVQREMRNNFGETIKSMNDEKHNLIELSIIVDK